MRGSKHKRKRIKLQCLECNSVFDDDYRKRHKQTCHQGKRVRVAHKDAPDNPFVAVKRSQSQKEYCEESKDRDQEDTAGIRGEDEEKNEEQNIFNIEGDSVPSCSLPRNFLTPVSTPESTNDTILIECPLNKNKLDTVKGFRIAHLNITSMLKYIEQLRLYLLNKPVDVFTINETRLDESISNVEVNIQGYNLWRKDRCTYGGGVAIYTRDILNVREMSSFVPENIEAVSLEIIKPKTQPILITTVYRPPSFNTNFIDDLENYLHVLDGQNKELILTGDLNCDLSLSILQSHSRRLMDILELDIIATNRLDKVKERGVIHLYADDTQIFATSNDSVTLANDLNSDLENVTDWLNVNKLQSHPSKTKLMVIGSKQNLINKTGDLHTSIFMNNNLVSPVISNKCLGDDLDHKLTFHTYIEEIFKKICSGIGVLRRIRQFVPQGSLITLYNSLIQPYFDYCSPLWDTCDKTLRNKLQILQNRAARVIMGTRYDDRIRSSDLLQSLGWDTLHVRWAKLKSVLLYKILNENYSPCLRDMFVRLRDLNRQYNLRNYDMDLALPKPKTNFLKRSFKYNASLLWNNLPLEAKTATSLHQFKRSIANCRFLESC